MLLKNKFLSYGILFIIFLLLIFSFGCKKIPSDERLINKSFVEEKNLSICINKTIFKEDFEKYNIGSLAEDKFEFFDLNSVGVSEYSVKTLADNKAYWLRLRGVRIFTDALMIKDKIFDNFILKFKIHDSEPYSMNPAVILRYSGKGYYLIIFDEYNKVKVYLMPEEKILVNVESFSLKKRWHDIEIKVNGSLFEGFIDGLKIFSFSDDSLKEGMVGFANGDGSLGEYYLDDVSIIKTIC